MNPLDAARSTWIGDSTKGIDMNEKTPGQVACETYMGRELCWDNNAPAIALWENVAEAVRSAFAPNEWREAVYDACVAHYWASFWEDNPHKTLRDLVQGAIEMNDGLAQYLAARAEQNQQGRIFTRQPSAPDPRLGLGAGFDPEK